MSDGSDELIGTLIFYGVIGLIGWLAWTPITDRFADRLTAYPAVCRSGIPGPSTCPQGRWIAEDYRAIFAIMPAQQMVVIQHGDRDPVRLNNCTVMDREKWQCDYYRVIDGQVTFVDATQVRYLPRWRWYLLKYGDSQPEPMRQPTAT